MTFIKKMKHILYKVKMFFRKYNKSLIRKNIIRTDPHLGTLSR